MEPDVENEEEMLDAEELALTSVEPEQYIRRFPSELDLEDEPRRKAAEVRN